MADRDDNARDDGWRYRPPQHPWLTILYSDASVVVLDKPAGLLSVPGRHPDRQDSLFTRVCQRYPHARIVHRLDMDTSGVMVIARTRADERVLDKHFQARRVEKVYRARVWGQMNADLGVIDLPLRRLRGLLRSTIDYGNGKVARTMYTVLERDAETSLVRLVPQTGRSHQLRVHLRALGHPIVGDRFYAPPAASSRSSRMLLHAHVLAFDHPTRGERMRFMAALPLRLGG